jgi:Rod binding domain-containing protein
MSLSGLPAVSDAVLPAAVRNGTEADKDNYKAALGFEQVMLGELVKEMTKGTPSLNDGPRGDAVHDAMTDALADAGGIGLAQQLFTTLQKVTP